MAGDIRAKERAIITLTSTGASLTNLSAGAAGTALDCTATGNAPDDLQARFELTCQVSGAVAAGLSVAELYLVPKLDGTNLPDLNTTAGASRLPATTLVGVFDTPTALSTSTTYRFVSAIVDLFPTAYTAYILNRSGVSISANWTLKAVTAQAQYT